MKTNLPDIERRFTTGKVELRADSAGNLTTVRGYAAMFGQPSENLGGFREIIKRGAFDNVLGDDVRALFNHDSNLILARTKSKTLTIGVDDVGLFYEFVPADTQAGRDLKISIERRDVDQSSFAFTVKRDGQEWTDAEDGKMKIRTINKVSRLYDVSPVTYPAYPDTSVALRALNEIRGTTANGCVTSGYLQWEGDGLNTPGYTMTTTIIDTEGRVITLPAGNFTLRGNGAETVVAPPKPTGDFERRKRELQLIELED